MPNQKKQQTVRKLSELLKSYSLVVLTDYSTLTHKQLEGIRNKIKDSHGDLHITKNALLTLALKSAGKSQEDKTLLRGATAIVLATEEDFTPLRILHETSKEHQSFTIKGGIWNTNMVDSATIIRLATLPSREILIAKLLGQLKTPHTKLVLTLKNPLTKLAIVLDAIKNKQSATSN